KIWNGLQDRQEIEQKKKRKRRFSVNLLGMVDRRRLGG
ncbi:hypothetical protein VN97_g7591, partial [Penicillium thymicola]